MNFPAPAEVKSAGRMPRQIPYIIANEGCERFSFYGMRNILTPFLISTLLLFVAQEHRASEAKHVFHTCCSSWLRNIAPAKQSMCSTPS